MFFNHAVGVVVPSSTEGLGIRLLPAALAIGKADIDVATNNKILQRNALIRWPMDFINRVSFSKNNNFMV